MIGMVKWKRNLFLFCLAVALIITLNWPGFSCATGGLQMAQAPETPNNAYRWQNVAIGGGGFVTGLVIHPTEKDLTYIRTDVGGIYRWEEDKQHWIPLMEMISSQDSHLFGIESIALDRNDPNIIYVAAGEYTDERARGKKGAILKSTDRGQTWSRYDLPVKVGSNEDWRWNGERLAVDPNKSEILYLGSRKDGLWKSTNGGKTWTAVSGFPTKGTDNRGVSFVIFDRNSGNNGNPTPLIYAGVAGAGVYRSPDGGKSWSLLSFELGKNPQRGVLAENGTLYVTYDSPGAIAKFQNNAWTDITPAKLNAFNAIGVDANNPDNIVAAEWFFNHGNKLYRTTDGGQTWQEIKATRQDDIPWHDRDARFWASGISSIVIDPHNAKRVWYTDGWGVWRTDNIAANPSTWRTYAKGHEEIVNFTMKSQPESGALLQGSGDIGGMRHTDLNRYPQKQFQSPSWMASDFVSIDSSESNPNFVVAIGSRRWTSKNLPDPGYSLYSTDDGKNWSEFPNYPKGFRKTFRGRVAVSATKDDWIVWVPEGEKTVPYYSPDRGRTWKMSEGAPAGLLLSVWQLNQPLSSDKVNGSKFYLYKEGKLHVSLDGGANWSPTPAVLPKLDMDWATGTWSTIKAAPGIEGEVWASFNTMGLYRSRDSGQSFNQLENIQQAVNFGFGKNPPGQTNPTVFVYGKVNNTDGIFRSDNMGKTWLKIDVPGQPIGKGALYVEGDRKVYGRVYIGTGGRGIYYGEPGNTRGSAAPKQESLLGCTASWIKARIFR